jgi:hypothetical protein
MNVLGKSGAQEEQLVLINPQPTGLNPPGAMLDQILISADFDASLDEMFAGELEPAMFTKPNSATSSGPQA